MDITGDTTSILYGSAFVLAISLISLLLSDAVSRLIQKMMGKRDVD